MVVGILLTVNTCLTSWWLHGDLLMVVWCEKMGGLIVETSGIQPLKNIYWDDMRYKGIYVDIHTYMHTYIHTCMHTCIALHIPYSILLITHYILHITYYLVPITYYILHITLYITYIYIMYIMYIYIFTHTHIYIYIYCVCACVYLWHTIPISVWTFLLQYIPLNGQLKKNMWFNSGFGVHFLAYFCSPTSHDQPQGSQPWRISCVFSRVGR